MRERTQRRERSFKATYANGGPGFSGFDRRIEQDGLWYQLSANARRLYACGYLVFERRGLVEVTQRELAESCGMAHKTIVASRRELEEAGLIRILRGFTGTRGDVVEMLEYAPALSTRRKQKQHEEKIDALDRAIADNPALLELRKRFQLEVSHEA